MNWPEYAVWNEQQAQFVRSVSGQFIRMINVCGPVPFIDSGEKIQDLPANSIAVFSVAAQRSSSLARRGVLPEYYSSDSIVQFLEQSYQAISRINGTMVLKTKRQSLSGDDRAYLDYVETLAKRSNVICIDSDVAAARLIERTNASISIPFTSTALVAESFGKPACYYDAARLLDVSYKGHEGVEFFSDALSVESWLSRVMDDPSPLKSLA
jgi:polysaccharide biosynthesis PFTS motif protein